MIADGYHLVGDLEFFLFFRICFVVCSRSRNISPIDVRKLYCYIIDIEMGW